MATGRDAEVYEYDETRVLRRYRDGRSATPEAALMRGLAALGFPVPRVHAVAGADLVLERVDGPTLAVSVLDGLSPDRAGQILAELHDRLHALAWPGLAVGQSLLHLDLHPLNVIMSESAPVLIDWSNACPGPPGLDVAMTGLILAQVTLAPGPLGSLAPSLPLPVDEPTTRNVVTQVLRAFARHTRAPSPTELMAALELRGGDRHQTTDERQVLPSARELLADLSWGHGDVTR